MRCAGVERAVAVCSDSELILFVQLNPAATIHSSSSQLPPVRLTSPSDQHADNIISPTVVENNDNISDNVVAVVDGREVGSKQQLLMMTDEETESCKEIHMLLRQWLPVHCQPDHIECVDKMPTTHHGQYFSRCHHCSSHCHHGRHASSKKQPVVTSAVVRFSNI